MKATQIATTINTIDNVLTAIELAARFTTKAIRTTWAIAQPIVIISLAIALVLSFKTYELGQAFGRYCDRLVESSLAKPPQQMLLAPVAIAGLLTSAKEADPMPPVVEEAKPRAKRQPKATAKPASESKQRSKRQPKAKAGDYEDLIAPNHNEAWAAKRIPLGTLKPGAIDFDVAAPFAG